MIPDIYQGESLFVFYGGIPNEWRSFIFCEHLLEDNELLPKTECFRNLALEKQYGGKVEYFTH